MKYTRLYNFKVYYTNVYADPPEEQWGPIGNIIVGPREII